MTDQPTGQTQPDGEWTNAEDRRWKETYPPRALTARDCSNLRAADAEELREDVKVLAARLDQLTHAGYVPDDIPEESHDDYPLLSAWIVDHLNEAARSLRRLDDALVLTRERHVEHAARIHADALALGVDLDTVGPLP